MSLIGDIGQLAGRLPHWQPVRGKPEAMGVAVSLGVHALLIGAAIGLMPDWTKAVSELEPEVVPIEVVSIADVPRVTEAPKPSVEAAPRETILDAPDQPEPDQAAPTTPSTDAVPLPEQKPEQGNRLDSRRLATVIDRSIKDAARRPREFDNLATRLEKDLPRTAVLSPAEAASLAQAMMAQILRCASFPTGAEDIARMRVMVRIQLLPDGRVVGQPTIVETEGQTSDNAPTFRVFTEAVKRAILRCQPYTLPADKYEAWREQDINVAPRDLVR
jgi:hypothetical protein